jgi:hypothetical protein
LLATAERKMVEKRTSWEGSFWLSQLVPKEAILEE